MSGQSSPSAAGRALLWLVGGPGRGRHDGAERRAPVPFLRRLLRPAPGGVWLEPFASVGLIFDDAAGGGHRRSYAGMAHRPHGAQGHHPGWVADHSLGVRALLYGPLRPDLLPGICHHRAGVHPGRLGDDERGRGQLVPSVAGDRHGAGGDRSGRWEDCWCRRWRGRSRPLAGAARPWVPRRCFSWWDCPSPRPCGGLQRSTG